VANEAEDVLPQSGGWHAEDLRDEVEGKVIENVKQMSFRLFHFVVFV
jgi:hypothetical protein